MATHPRELSLFSGAGGGLLATLTDVLTTRYGVEFRPMLNVVRVPDELLDLAKEGDKC